MTTDDRGCNMAWDFDNMLQTFSANGVTGLSNATYEYDGIGRRVAKIMALPGGATATTLFVQAGHQVTCEYTPGIVTADCDRKYAHGMYIDEVLSFVDATAAIEAKYWLHQNRQYNTHVVSANNGQCQRSYSYSAFGKRTSSIDSGPEVSISSPPFSSSYTGREEDAESGLVHFRNRVYSPQSGSFLNRDLAGYDDGRNLHARNFPLRSTDPYGTVATCEKKRCSGENVIHSGVPDPFGSGKNVDGSIFWCFTIPKYPNEPHSCDGRVPPIYTEQTFAEYLFKNFIEGSLRNKIANGNNPCKADNLDWECPLKCSGFEIRHHLGLRGKRVLAPDGREIHAFFPTCNTCVTCKCKVPKHQACVCSRHGCDCF